MLKKIKQIIIAILATVALVTGVNSHQAKANDKKDYDALIADLKKQLPNLTAPKISESPLPGLYEIIAGEQVFYWREGYLFMGEIFDVKLGKSITAEKKEAVRAERDKGLSSKIASLPLDKAVKLGNGKNIVIEFTDPDCPYCRKADDFLSKREDVTRYVFLFPLKNLHPLAANKSAWILSQPDKAAALREIFNGTYDKKTVPGFDITAMTTVEHNLKLGAELGITGTPVLIVNGSIVRGADVNKLKLLLESSKS